MKRKIWIFIIVLLVILIAIQNKYYNNEKVEYYTNKLVNKYNLNIDNLKFVSLIEEHKEKRGAGVWFDTYEVTVPDFIKFKYGDKIITVYGEQDDFYYDELVEAVRKYYSSKLEINKLYVDVEGALTNSGTSSSAYASYFDDNDVTAIDENVVKDFIHNFSIQLIVQIDHNDIENNIKKLIDKLKTLDKPVTVQVMSNISMIKTYRERPNYEYFDYYYIENIDYDYRYTRISFDKNNYDYSEIDYNAKI